MPLNSYDKYFGGTPGSAQKAANALKREYGTERGKQLFYAIVTKRRDRGRGDPMTVKRKINARS